MICLIRPPAVESLRFSSTVVCMPLGLAYVAGSLLAAGRRFEVVDAVAEGPTVMTPHYKGYSLGLRLEQIVERIPVDATVVGLTVIFTHEWPQAVRLVDLIRAARPDVKIVLGGEHVTAMPEFSLATSKADVLVMGEGEETFIELLDAFDEDGPLDQVAGIGFRDGDSIRINCRRERRTDVDDIPPPAWDRIDFATYSRYGYMGGIDVDAISIPILATRGCPYQCTFCSAPNMWVPRWIPRDPVQVVDEIERYVNDYGARSFPFQDLTAIIRKDWIVTFCNEILDRKLDITWQFPSGTRSEAIDDEVALLLRRTGMVNLAYAPESWSERTRKLIKKRMATDELLSSIKSAVAADLYVTTFAILGFPHDKEEDFEASLPMIREVSQLGVTDIGVAFYMALPGTEIFRSLYETGKIKVDRDYFAHILDAQALWPKVSYNESLSRFTLMRWKLRFWAAFYGTGPEGALERGVFAFWKRALGVLFSKNQNSRLQTAFRNGLRSVGHSLRARTSRRWMPRSEEAKLFEGWDEIYREIRDRLIEEGAQGHAPEDSADIHLENAIKAIRADHTTARTLQVGPRS